MRLRNYLIIANVLNGGVTDPHSIPPPLLKERYRVGNRTGHCRTFLALLRNAASWQAAAREYQNIGIPVLLVWGENDWARVSEREHDLRLIPGARMITVERGGHFLPLWTGPAAVIEHVRCAISAAP